MSRSGYSDDVESGALNLWRGTVARALHGKRGQAFLREMRDALDAMPVKRLVQEQLVAADGEVCAMGSVCARRGLDVSDLDPEDYDAVAARLGLSRAMVCEIAYLNDEDGWIWRERRHETPEERWARMRAWVERQITEARPPQPEQPKSEP